MTLNLDPLAARVLRRHEAHVAEQDEGAGNAAEPISLVRCAFTDVETAVGELEVALSGANDSLAADPPLEVRKAIRYEVSAKVERLVAAHESLLRVLSLMTRRVARSGPST